MEKNLDKIIDKCVRDILCEATIDIKKDSILGNAQKRIASHIKELVKKRDKTVIDLMQSMGYGMQLDKNSRIQKDSEIFNGSMISSELTNDIIEVTKILQKYVNDTGGINFNKLKIDHQNDYDMIIRLKNFIDLKGLTYLYDKTANIPSNPYGIDWAKGETEDNLDFNKITKQQIKDYRKGEREYWGAESIERHIKRRLVDQYLESKYGMSLEVPNVSFSNGNAKLPNNILIVNFTSAMNCPAWNECLVKHACYARAGEKKQPSAFRGNENKSLFWRASENDPTLLKYLMEFIRCYCFNYTKTAKEIVNQRLVKGGFRKLAEQMSHLELNDPFYTPEIIEIMKQNKRIDYIRLNENGDFIGQWLVDAWENEASKYKQYDIHVSAYTCRHLNYEGIKNLILNTSFVTGNGNIARHFIALPQDVYDALDETYGGPENGLIIGQDSVEPNPQPLFDVVNGEVGKQMKPNGKSYYKCPCNRGEGDDEINCYQCALCYQPKASDNTLYVFVAAHGGGQNNLNGYDLIKNDIGVSQNFFSRYQGKPMIESNNMGSQLLQLAYKRGIQGVANNAIHSVYTHFNQIDNKQVNESNVIRVSEKELMQLIKEEIFKHF